VSFWDPDLLASSDTQTLHWSAASITNFSVYAWQGNMQKFDAELCLLIVCLAARVDLLEFKKSSPDWLHSSKKNSN
jgi:hypothetical protein